MKITDWDQHYRDGLTPWDKGHPAPPLAEGLAKHPVSGRVLVPGCGVGHDVALLLTHGLDAVGLDVAPGAIERARARYPHHAERFVVGDLFATPAEWRGGFDTVVEHTCLCALPPELRIGYRDAVAELIKPGGTLWGIFYLNPQMDPGEEGPPFGISPDALTGLFESRFELLESYVPTSSYPGREGRECVRVMRRLAA